MPTIYEVKSGDNLSTIAKRYGVPFSAITGYRSGNPNLIYPGEKLTIGDSQGGDLGGTLPPAQPTGTTGKALPETPSDNLSVFRNLLRTVSERAGQEATATGVASMGFEPSRVSGGTLAGIVNFIKGQKTQGVADIYKSTTDLLDSQQKQAQDQLQILVNSNALGDLTDSALSKLSVISGADYDFLDSIRKQQQKEKSEPAYFNNVTRKGIEYRVGYDKAGNEISATPTGADPKKGTEGDKFTDLTANEKERVREWMANQPGFTQERYKQMDDDPTFYDFILSQYYNR